MHEISRQRQKIKSAKLHSAMQKSSQNYVDICMYTCTTTLIGHLINSCRRVQKHDSNPLTGVYKSQTWPNSPSKCFLGKLLFPRWFLPLPVGRGQKQGDDGRRCRFERIMVIIQKVGWVQKKSCHKVHLHMKAFTLVFLLSSCDVCGQHCGHKRAEIVLIFTVSRSAFCKLW